MKKPKHPLTVDQCAQRATQQFHDFFSGSSELDQYMRVILDNLDELSARERGRLASATAKVIIRTNKARERLGAANLLIAERSEPDGVRRF